MSLMETLKQSDLFAHEKGLLHVTLRATAPYYSTTKVPEERGADWFITGCEIWYRLMRRTLTGCVLSGTI